MAAPPLRTPRTCSQCGNNGHNARTCTETPGVGATGFMLFGVRLTAEGSPVSNSSSSNNNCFGNFRKSVSMGNLSQYEQQQQHPQDSCGVNGVDVGASGYASDDAIHASGSRSRERKRGVPWTEDEHRLFLMGLKKVGKGDWRGISRNFVKTRTPTQVASHAQKYFLRRTNNNRRRRRSSLFDITTDTVPNTANEDHSYNQDSLLSTISESKPLAPSNETVQIPKPFTSSMLPNSTKQIRQVPLIPVPPSTKMANLNLNQSPSSSTSTSTNNSSGQRDQQQQLEPLLSLKLSSQQPSDNEDSISRSPSAFGGFNSSGDSIISVA